MKEDMAQIDSIRNGIIDRLLAITDKDYLMALLRLVDKSSAQENKIKLTKEQKLMLEISEATPHQSHPPEAETRMKGVTLEMI